MFVKIFQKACKFVLDFDAMLYLGSCRAFRSDGLQKFYFNISTTTTKRPGTCSVPVLVGLNVLGAGGGVVEA